MGIYMYIRRTICQVVSGGAERTATLSNMIDSLHWRGNEKKDDGEKTAVIASKNISNVNYGVSTDQNPLSGIKQIKLPAVKPPSMHFTTARPYYSWMELQSGPLCRQMLT